MDPSFRKPDGYKNVCSTETRYTVTSNSTNVLPPKDKEEADAYEEVEELKVVEEKLKNVDLNNDHCSIL